LSLEKKLLDYFSDRLIAGVASFEITLSDVVYVEELQFLREECNCLILKDLCAVKSSSDLSRPSVSSGVPAIVYILYSFEMSTTISAKLLLKDESQAFFLKSVNRIWPNASWYEQEIINYFRLESKSATNQKISLAEKEGEMEISPLISKYEGRRHKWIPMGPNNSGNLGNFKVDFLLDAEKVIDVKIETGMAHRGIEELCETLRYGQIVALMERLDCNSPYPPAIGWCRSVESMMQLTIPQRAQALRMIFLELARVADHLFFFSIFLDNLAIVDAKKFFLNLRAQVVGLYRSYGEGLVLSSSVVIGGMARNLPTGWISECFNMIKNVAEGINRFDKKIVSSRIFRERTKICEISGAQAISWGYSGPNLRASGVNYDLRKVSPYYFYKDVDFEIPLGIYGDCYDRYLVRVEEVRQALRIIGQIIDYIPTGAFLLEDTQVMLSDKSKIKTSFTHLIDFTSLGLGGVKVPPSEIYQSVETSAGELGFFIVAEGTERPARVKIRSASYAHLQSYRYIAQGFDLSGALTILASLNISANEMDR